MPNPQTNTDQPQMPLEQSTAMSQKTRDKMAQEGYPVINKVLARFKNSGVAKNDLVSAGHKGLLKAIDKFNPDKGIQFTSFVYICIRSAMLDEIRSQARKKKSEVLGGTSRFEDEGISLLDSLPDESQLSEKEQANLLSRKAWLYEALEHLSTDQRKLIELLFFKGMSHKEAGEKLGISSKMIAKRRDAIIGVLQENMPAAA